MKVTKNHSLLLINLHNNSERLINALNNLRKCNLNEFVVRKEACTVKRAKKEYHKYINTIAYNNIHNLRNTLILPTWGAVACAISHLECYKYIIDNNLEFGIICEDDFEIVNLNMFKMALSQGLDIIAKFRNSDSNLNRKIIITFGSKQIDLQENINYQNYGYMNFPIVNNETDNLENIINPFIGTQFYIVNYNMAKKLYNNLKPLIYQIDIQIGLFIKRLSYTYNYDVYFNFKNAGIIHSKKFKSNVQYYFIKQEDLEFLNLSGDVINHILTFLPNNDNTQKAVQNSNIFNLMSSDTYY